MNAIQEPPEVIEHEMNIHNIAHKARNIGQVDDTWAKKIEVQSG